MTFGQTRSRLQEEERRVRGLRHGPESNNDGETTSEMMTTFQYIEQEKECLRIYAMEKQKKKLLCCRFWNWNKLNLNTYYYYYDDYIYDDDQTHKKIILFRNKHYDYLGASSC